MTDETLREIVEFYTKTPEESRLGRGSSQLEFERTQELIRRFLPAAAVRVADVGGASGPYAFWLAAQGGEVHLILRVARLLEEERSIVGAGASGGGSTSVSVARYPRLDVRPGGAKVGLTGRQS
jgi:hypothetical protein